MIRIDLKKGDLAKGARKAPTSASNSFKFLTMPLNPKVAQITQEIRSFGLLGAVAALSFLPYLFFTQYRAFVISQHQSAVVALKSDSDGLELEIQKLRPFQKELENFEKQKKMVSDRLAVVNRLLNSRNAPVQVLDAIGQSMPVRTWVGGMDFSLKERPGTVTITGNAYNHEDISDFTERLSESSYLSEVVLEDVGAATVKGLEVKGFVIRIRAKDMFAPEPAREATSNVATGSLVDAQAAAAGGSPAPGAGQNP